MHEPWTPECSEDELLLAFVDVKRGLIARTGSADPGSFPVLRHLAASGPSRQGALAEHLFLDASTVSRHVRSLVDDGLVEASRDPEDGRASVLAITERGREHMRDRLQLHRAVLRRATTDFTSHERSELIRLLHKLADSLSEHQETTP